MNIAWRQQSFRVALIAIIATCLCTFAAPQPTFAQDQDEDALAAELGGGDAGLDDPPPEQAAANGDQAGGGEADGAADEDDTGPKAPKNLLAWTFQSLGIFYTIIFFALSITLLTLVVMNILAVRQDNICPPDLVEGVEQQLGEGNPGGAASDAAVDGHPALSPCRQPIQAGAGHLDRERIQMRIGQL